MALSDLTSRRAVLESVREYDQLGRDEFLSKYGFGPARRYFLRVDGREYDSKAIVAVAHGIEFPRLGALRAAEFTGGALTVEKKLRALGFEVIRR